MAMNQPIPPEQQPQPAAAPVQPEVAAAPAEQAPVQEAPAAPAADVQAQDPQAHDEQVVEEVTQGLADEEITAEDIMTAVLSDALGLTPQGAQSLFRLLMTEITDEEEAPAKDVPPQEGV